MPLVDERYAYALLSIAAEKGYVERFREDVQSIADMYEGQNDLKAVLDHAGIQPSLKKNIITEIFKDELSSDVFNMLMLLLDKHRISFLPGIVREYNILADKKQNIITMKIYSALPLEDMVINRIKEKYRQLYNASFVRADVEIDNKLIGGLKIKIGDKVIDGTLAARLQDLKGQLLKS